MAVSKDQILADLKEWGIPHNAEAPYNELSKFYAEVARARKEKATNNAGTPPQAPGASTGGETQAGVQTPQAPVQGTPEGTTVPPVTPPAPQPSTVDAEEQAKKTALVSVYESITGTPATEVIRAMSSEALTGEIAKLTQKSNAVTAVQGTQAQAPMPRREGVTSFSSVGSAIPTLQNPQGSTKLAWAMMDQQTKQLLQMEAERKARVDQVYYKDYPAIRGGICEFCGVHYSKCKHYKEYYDRLGKFICMCGRSQDERSAGQLSLLYVPHRGRFVCDSAGCEKAYHQQFGGFERKVSWHLFRREVPPYSAQIGDPSDNSGATTL